MTKPQDRLATQTPRFLLTKCQSNRTTSSSFTGFKSWKWTPTPWSPTTSCSWRPSSKRSSRISSTSSTRGPIKATKSQINAHFSSKKLKTSTTSAKGSSAPTVFEPTMKTISTTFSRTRIGTATTAWATAFALAASGRISRPSSRATWCLSGATWIL